MKPALRVDSSQLVIWRIHKGFKTNKFCLCTASITEWLAGYIKILMYEY